MKRRRFLMSAPVAATAAALASVSDAAERRAAFVVRAGEGRFGEHTVLFGGTSPNDIKVSSGDTGGALSMFEYVGHLRGGPALHLHPHQDEIFFVREGDYLFEVGGERRRLGAGETIFLPRNVPHRFAQLSEAGKMLFVFQPAGAMEAYFRALAKVAGPQTQAEEEALFAAYDMLRVGPAFDLSEIGEANGGAP